MPYDGDAAAAAFLEAAPQPSTDKAPSLDSLQAHGLTVHEPADEVVELQHCKTRPDFMLAEAEPATTDKQTHAMLVEAAPSDKVAPSHKLAPSDKLKQASPIRQAGPIRQPSP